MLRLGYYTSAFTTLALLLGLYGLPLDLYAQSFTRVTTGPVATDAHRSLGVAWGDYDADGFLDLFIANAGQLNRLYHNNYYRLFTHRLSAWCGR